MKFSRKKAAHAVLAWTLSLALAAPAASMTAFAAVDNTTQTQQTTDTQNQQPPQPPQGAQNGQPPPGPPPNGQAPNGQQGQSPQGAPGQQQGKSASELTAAKVVDGTQATLSGETYDATETDANAVLVRNGGTLSLSQATLSKTGDSSSADASNFTGQNAIFLAADSTATLSHLTMTSDAYVTTIEDAAEDYENIASNGHNIYYDATADTALGGKTYALPGGGKLLPKK